MYTLYGKKGSGSATTQAALELIGAPYRLIETASWEPNAAFAELLKLNRWARFRRWCCPTEPCSPKAVPS